MAGVYNKFEIKFDIKDYAEKAKPVAEDLFRETGYKMQDEFLVWEEVEATGGAIRGEVYCGADDDDLEKSRLLFENLCKRLMHDFPMAAFMGKHSFDYSNTDATDYLLCFRKDMNLTFYNAEVVDDVGCMNAKRYTLQSRFLKFSIKEEHEYDDLLFGNDEDSDNDFIEVLEGYDKFKYPKKQKKSSKKEPKEPKYEVGKFYLVRYRHYREEKELIGKFALDFANQLEFETMDYFVMTDGTVMAKTDYVDKENIISSKEIYATEETNSIIEESKNIAKELDNIEKNQLSQLREKFWSLYSEKGDSWKKRKLEKQDIGQSYLGVEELEVGRTYLVNAKEKGPLVTKDLGVDAVLVVSCFEDSISKKVRAMGCAPGVFKTNIVILRSLIASNLDEFTHEIFPDSDGEEIQKQRLELYNKMNGLIEKRKQLKEDYLKSFSKTI